MVICIGVSLLLLGPWLPFPRLWAILGSFSLCPECGLIVGFCLLTPGCGVFAWLFCWLCPYVGVGFCFSCLIGCLC